MITNESKNFDIVTPNGLESIGVKQLTLKEREKLFLQFEETIKNRRRKEYVEMSKMMDGKDKTKYLVECANSNKVSVEEVTEESQTVNGITEIFKLTASKQLDWTAILSDEAMILPTLKAFYWSLGVEIPDELEVEENTKIGEIVPGEAQQEITFPTKI